MLSVRLSLLALVAAGTVAAQNASSNSSNGSSTALTPAALMAALPNCSQSCLVPALQFSHCSLIDSYALLDCFCMSTPAQANMSACIQINCGTNTYDAGVGLYVESAMCAGYPKESRKPEIYAICIVTLCLAIPIVIGRCIARYRLTSRLWPDDYMSVVATAFLIALAAIQAASAEIGFGEHIWEFDFSNYTKIMLLNYVGKAVYVWIQLTAKLAVLLLYYRVFKLGGSTWFQWAIKIGIAWKLVIGTTYTFIILFGCSPVSGSWDSTITDAKCLDFNLTVLTGAVVSIFEDIVLVLLPIPALRTLKVSGRKRLEVAIMFGIASFGTVASIVRLVYLQKLSNDYDQLWSQVDIVIWSLLENLITVVCGSLPALRPYIDPWIPRISISWSRTRTYPGRSGYNGGTGATNHTSQSKRSKKNSFAMAPISPPTQAMDWKPLPGEPDGQEKVPKDLETGVLRRNEAGSSESESENDLIIQGNGAQVAYNVKVWSNNHGGWKGGPAAEEYASAGDTPRAATTTPTAAARISPGDAGDRNSACSWPLSQWASTAPPQTYDFLNPPSTKRPIARVASLDKMMQ